MSDYAQLIKKQITLSSVYYNSSRFTGADADRLILELKSAGIGTYDTLGRSGELYQNTGSLVITDNSELVALLNTMTKRPAIVGFGTEIRSGAEIIVEDFSEIDLQFLDRMEKRAHGLPWTICYTERCVVKEITLDDMDDLFEMYAAPHFTDYLEPLYERKKEEEYTKNYIDTIYRFYGYGMWVIRDIENQEFIGRAGFGFRHIDGTDEVYIDLGYSIKTQYQRQGYAYEVCKKLVEYAWNNLSLTQLNCFICPGNEASIGLINKLGFEYRDEITENGIIFKRFVLNLPLLFSPNL